MANASFYQHFPRAARNPQPNPKPTRDQWRQRGYLDAQGRVARKLFLGHYVGDYDSPSWLYKAVPKFFPDPARGRVPLGWAFDPNLADRAPQAMVYAYLNATTNDFFIAGDSGAGYLNPRGLTVRPGFQAALGAGSLEGLLPGLLSPVGHDDHRVHAGWCQRRIDRRGICRVLHVQPGWGGNPLRARPGPACRNRDLSRAGSAGRCCGRRESDCRCRQKGERTVRRFSGRAAYSKALPGIGSFRNAWLGIIRKPRWRLSILTPSLG